MNETSSVLFFYLLALAAPTPTTPTSTTTIATASATTASAATAASTTLNLQTGPLTEPRGATQTHFAWRGEGGRGGEVRALLLCFLSLLPPPHFPTHQEYPWA